VKFKYIFLEHGANINYITNYHCSKKRQFASIFCHYTNEESWGGPEAIPKPPYFAILSIENEVFHGV
jgi:hypothetical protein